MAPAPENAAASAAVPAAADLPRAPPGALRCQKDSSLRSLATRVLACDEVVVPATKKTPEERFYEVELYDTVLFPEGGGQPWDTGKINNAAVDKVYVKDGRCIHRVPVVTSGAAAPFEKDQEVVASVDWDRRFDHMQQHSAQHLFSAIAEKYGYDTTTWSMGEERNNVELVPFPGSEAEAAFAVGKKSGGLKVIPMDVLLKIEEDVNDAIVRGLSMQPKFATSGTPEWEKIAAKFSDDERPEAMRIVCIDGIDANPCCGTHVQNLGQLQSLRVLNVEAARGASRVWFVAGKRVNREFSRMFRREQAMVKLFSCGPEEHASRAEKLLQFQKSALKDIKNLQKELAASIATELLAQSQSGSESPAPVAQYHRVDGDVAFLQAILSHLGDAKEKTVFVLAVGEVRGEGMFLLAGPAPFIAKHGKDVVQVIGGKGGGGKNGIFQGKAKGLSKLDDLVAKLKELRAAE
uniref:Threonyl/alanyl tRNA synthetase SAD domain-containing protein n=1 Tax=Globisporangium ultimum (strain ATCC 200006 / CBS 805.95 / DAOM BR144) TaxID=431595 RepID=K3WPL9_GLOUD